MDISKIDLYDYFKIDRNGATGGYLFVYICKEITKFTPQRKHPGMLIIPGGGYYLISERESEPVALAFLHRGYNCFILNYSCTPVHYPAQLLEAVMSMIYLRKNAEDLHIRADKIATIGFSAGGHLAALLGSYYDADEVKSIFNYSPTLARPDALVLGYPVITSLQKSHMGSFNNLCGNDNELLIKKLSIEKLVNKNSSPAFIWSIMNDEVVPVQNSLLLAEAYDKEGVDFSIHIWGKGKHGLSVADDNVYSTNEECHFSNSITSWIDLSSEWLCEHGFRIKD